MMKNKCVSPIVLKNGCVVPCGKCEICRTNVRLEWQYRLRIHLMSCDYMPMFITLTYAPEQLPYGNDGPICYRPDASAFIKQYKRKYGLNQKDFQYFGCSERGDIFGRPHFHFLFFGDRELYFDFMNDSEVARKRIYDVWNKGHVHVGVAGYDGIAYVTKYVLKQEGMNDSFTIASNGIGMNFLNTEKAEICRRTLYNLTVFQDKILSECPDVDFSNKRSIMVAIEYMRQYIPDFTVVLDDGTKVFLPRAIRKKLTGTFEHFKDNPLWFWNFLNQCYDSIDYYEQNGDYDLLHERSMSWELSFQRICKINQNKNINRYNKLQKKLLYEAV